MHRKPLTSKFTRKPLVAFLAALGIVGGGIALAAHAEAPDTRNWTQTCTTSPKLHCGPKVYEVLPKVCPAAGVCAPHLPVPRVDTKTNPGDRNLVVAGRTWV